LALPSFLNGTQEQELRSKAEKELAAVKADLDELGLG